MEDPRLGHYRRQLKHRIDNEQDDTVLEERYSSKRYFFEVPHFGRRYFPTLDEMRKFLRGAIASYAYFFHTRILGDKLQPSKKNDPVRKEIGQFIKRMNDLVKMALRDNRDPLFWFNQDYDHPDNDLKVAAVYIFNYDPAVKPPGKGKMHPDKAASYIFGERKGTNAKRHCRNARENKRIAQMMAQRAAKATYAQYMDYECGDVYGDHDNYIPPKKAYNRIARMKRFKPTVDEMYEEHAKDSRPTVSRDTNLRYERADRRRKMVENKSADNAMGPLILEARPEYLTNRTHSDAQ